MTPTIYFVRFVGCTDLEPWPGWYVATEEGDPCGPFETRAEARDAVVEAEETRP